MKRILADGTEHYLTVSKTSDGKPVMLSWQTEDHEIVEVLWDVVSGVPLKAITWNREKPKLRELPMRDYT